MKRRFAVSHRARFKFLRRGLRHCFEYRDCGIGRATLRRREIRHSPDLEMLEVAAPANFRTPEAAAPVARKSPGRRSRG